jgi:S1-C subfamily serine protease
MCAPSPLPQAEVMANNLSLLSGELTGAVAQAGKSVVGVHAGKRWGASGVVWRDGIIVTTEHTIRRREEIPITLPDGSASTATLAGSDPGSDLAVLRTTAALPPIGKSAGELQPGNLALAIGRSADTGVNATLGIVSALGPGWRNWRGGRLDRYIRLDLNLYPGTAGGAVVNSAGDAIGIATPIMSRLAAVAIPASTIDRVVDELVQRGRVSRGFLGVGMQPVQLPDHLKRDGSASALIVLTVQTDGPAARAGILIGDILVALDGQPVSDTDDIQAVLETRSVGQTVTAGLLRGGEPRDVPVVIGEKPQGAQ